MRALTYRRLAGAAITLAALAPMGLGYALYESAQTPTASWPSVEVTVLGADDLPRTHVELKPEAERTATLVVERVEPPGAGWWRLRIGTTHVKTMAASSFLGSDTDSAVALDFRSGERAIWTVTTRTDRSDVVLRLDLDVPIAESGGGETVVAYPAISWAAERGNVGGSFGAFIDIDRSESPFGGLRAGEAGAEKLGTALWHEIDVVADERQPDWSTTACRLHGGCVERGVYRYRNTRDRRSAETRLLWSGIAFGLGGNAIVALAGLGAARVWRRARRVDESNVPNAPV